MSGDLKRFHTGEQVRAWPDGTWNQFAAGEERDRAKGPRRVLGGDEAFQPPQSSARVKLKNTTEADLGVGKVLALGTAIYDPADKAAAVFEVLQFNGEEPTADSAHVAVLQMRIAAGGIGWGAIPNAAWAKVDVSDEDHDSADVAAATLLESANGGRFPIIWKQSGTGEKWAIIALSSSGGDSIRTGLVTVAATPATGPLAAEWGTATVQLHDPVTGADDGAPIEVKNKWKGLIFPVGATCEIAFGSGPARFNNSMCAIPVEEE